MNKRSRTSLLLLTVLLSNIALQTSCTVSEDAKEHAHADFDVKAHVGVEFPSEAFDFGELGAVLPTDKVYTTPNYSEEGPRSFKMTVIDEMDIYESTTSQYAYNTLKAGEIIRLTEPEDGKKWATVHALDGTLLGYTKDGFLHAINDGISVYAELPVEYGKARDNAGNMIDAYSHLVDIGKYLNVYYSTDPSNEGIDITKYDVKVSMKLSTEETSIGEPFYKRNLCLIQYDTLQKLVRAINLFRKDGYTVVIYDAYRPTSVQQRWFDVVRVHKWVADPSRGMGGIHDRGTALDISLIDADGNELNMPTPMHTFTNESARTSEAMTEEQRANMDYMTRIMTSCGFTYITSEWWHFQCVYTKNYLPTDHPIDSIPLVPAENKHAR